MDQEGFGESECAISCNILNFVRKRLFNPERNIRSNRKPVSTAFTITHDRFKFHA